MQKTTRTSTARSTDERKLTAREVANVYGVTVPLIWRYCREGRLPHARLGRAIRFDKSELDAWFAGGGAPGVAAASTIADDRIDQ